MTILTHEKLEEISIIKLDDGKANVMGPSMIKAINNGLDEAQENSRAVLIIGRPGLLSGGFDLSIIKSGDTNAIQAMVNAGARLLMRIYGFSIPVVMATTGHGVALGGFLLLAADYRFGVEGDYKIGLNEVAIGMTLPPFGQMLAKARIAPQYLTNTVINANLYDPKSAQKAGFLDEVTTVESLLQTSINKTKELALLDPLAFEKTKQNFRQEDIARILSDLDSR